MSALLGWFVRDARDLPWRRTHDPYAIWVSEIMLQQTQVTTVVSYYERWMKDLPDVGSLARASSQRLHKLWEGLGYYSRVRNMQKAAKVICQQHRSRFPDQFADILALPGIGRYTAGAICSIAFNQPAPILDGNVIRVLTRVFGIASDPRQPETNARLWRLAEALVTEAARRNPQSSARNHPFAALPCSALNQSLMELGAVICTPRNPRCPACPIRRLCVARRKGLTRLLPARRERPPITRKRVLVFAVQNRNRVWIVRQPSKKSDGGLWEFPSLEANRGRTSPSRAAERILPFRSTQFARLTTFQHHITRYNITVIAFRGKTDDQHFDGGADAGRWVTIARLRSLPLPAAHRRIADVICAGPKSSATQAPLMYGNPQAGAIAPVNQN